MNQKGVSIIAVVATMLVLAVMGVTLISLVTTGSDVSINQLQSEQAFNIATGGIEFEQRSLAQNLDWYRSTTDPIATTSRNLGAGSFTVSSNLPATMLSRRLVAGGGTANVYTTQRFPTACPTMPGAVCYLQIEDDIAGTAEFVSYTNTTPTTFTGITKNRTIGGITGVVGDAAHARGSRVYPVTTLLTALTNVCATIPNPFQITYNPKFLSAGTISIYDATGANEEIAYTGSSTSGNTTTLTGVQRCQPNGTGTPLTLPVGSPVTPITVDGTSPDYEAEIISTGTVSNSAQRVVKKTAQR